MTNVTVPREALDALVRVAQHVSAGRTAAFTQEQPYPDALARQALGWLDDEGFLVRVEKECKHRDPNRLGHRPGDLALVCACGTTVFPERGTTPDNPSASHNGQDNPEEQQA